MSAGLKVSVVIPAYNAAGTIVRALRSVLAQTRPPEEIVVVDDVSTDGTSAVVSGFTGCKVKLIALSGRKGAGGARNAGIGTASGDLVAFLDADDEWLAAKLEKQVRLFADQPDLSFVACASNMISAEGVDVGDTYSGRAAVTGLDAWKALLACNFVATPTVVAWRKNLIALGGFDEALKVGEDQDMWIRLAMAAPIGYVPESLVRVHLRKASLSTWAFSDFARYTLPMIERHVAQRKNELTRREIRHIMGMRFSQVGRVTYANGDIFNGAPLVFRSMLLGYKPFESAFYLATAAPPAVWLKRQLGLGGTR